MRYKIFENGEEINVIIASEEFVADYCERNGYTFEEAQLPTPPEPDPEPEPEPEPSVWDELDAAYQEGYLKGVNTAYDE